MRRGLSCPCHICGAGALPGIMVILMIFGRKKSGRFDGLNPLTGPGIDVEIRTNTRQAELAPVIPLGCSRDGCQLELIRFTVCRTFDGLPPDRPWAMSVAALQQAERDADTVLEPWYLRVEDAPPGTEETAISLPPYRILASLWSHDYVPEEDESCWGSRADIAWFTKSLDKWKENLAHELADRLDWRPIAHPLWRNSHET